jgi:hypothetical protein
VKPANLGSSVGISKVKTESELPQAIDLALEFDRKVVVEAAVPEAREIECAVLGNDEAEASVAGEIIPSREFYDYEAKYLDENSRTIIPADLPDAKAAEVRRYAVEAFKAIDGAGMSRIDRRDLRERDQHDSRLHHDQHVRQVVGGKRRELSHARRQADPARPGATLAEATTPNKRDVVACGEGKGNNRDSSSLLLCALCVSVWWSS